jgi:hypothetical protein
MDVETFVSQLRSELAQIEQEIQRMERSETGASLATARSPGAVGRVDLADSPVCATEN